MNIQLKQKIIGAVIIAIFLAVAVPLLFSGTRSKNNSNTTTPIAMQEASPTAASVPPTPIQPTTPPIPTQTAVNPIPQPSQPTIPTAQTSTVQTPQANLNTAPSTTPILPVATKTTASTTSNMALNNPVVTTTAAVPTATMPSISGNIEPRVSTTTQNPALEQSLNQKQSAIIASSPHKNAHKNNKAKTIVEKSKLGTVKKHKLKNTENIISSINLGGYSEPQKAQNLVNKLKKDGYHAYTKKVKVKHKNLTVVLVGPIKNQEKAEKLANKISKNFGIKAKVIPKQ